MAYSGYLSGYSPGSAPVAPADKHAFAYIFENILLSSRDVAAHTVLLENVTDEIPTPHIWFLHPDVGNQGEVITIVGHGFGTTREDFNGQIQFGPTTPDPLTWIQSPPSLINPLPGTIDPETDVVDPEHNRVTFQIPPGVGSNYVRIITNTDEAVQPPPAPSISTSKVDGDSASGVESQNIQIEIFPQTASLPGTLVSDSREHEPDRDYTGTLSGPATGFRLDQLQVGQDAYGGDDFAGPHWTASEFVLSFDTSTIQGTIQSAVLRLATKDDQSLSQEFVIEARLFGWGPTMNSGDWRTPAQLASLPLLATYNTSSGLTPQQYTSLSDVAMVANINRTGTTRMIFNSDRMRNQFAPQPNFANTAPEYVAFHPADHATLMPRLVVTLA